MASDIKMILTVFLITSLASFGQAAGSNSIESSRVDLNLKLINLDINFADKIQELFYEKRDDADNDYPVLGLLAEIARLELAQHRRERQALMIADDIYEKYFASTGTSSSNDWPPKTNALAKLIVSRLIQRACEKELHEEQYTRRRIYEIFENYQHLMDVQDIASDYAMRLKDRKSRATAAKAVMEEALDSFRGEVSRLGVYSAAQLSQVLASVDEIIKGVEDRFHPPRNEQSEEDTSRDIADTAREASAHIRTGSGLGVFGMDMFTMEFVEDFEDSQAMLHIDNVLTDLDIELNDLDDEFKLTIDDIFTDTQAVSDADGDIPLKAMSARMAECESLLYSAEKRMLLIMRDAVNQYFVDKTKQLTEPLIDNKNLIDLILRRATAHAIEGGFQEIAHLRKEIYLMALKHEGSHLEGLARQFYASIRLRKDEISEDDADSFLHLRKYKNDVGLVLSDAKISETMRAVDRLIDEAVAMDHLSELDQTGTLKEFIGNNLLEQIIEAKNVYELNQTEVGQVNLQDVLAYEELILGPTTSML